MFREEKEGLSEEASKNFCEEDIDSILQRSTLIVHKSGLADDANVQEGQSGGALNTFSKASFVSSKEGQDNDVAIDDPQFWEKVVGVGPGEEDGNESMEEYFDEDGVVQRRPVKRKRRCKAKVNTYNEADMYVQKLNEKGNEEWNNEDSASDSDSIENVFQKRGTRVPKRFAVALLRQTAEKLALESQNDSMTPLDAAACEELASHLGIYGYGNWAVICTAMGNLYSIRQISMTSRKLILHAFKSSCMAQQTTTVLDDEGNPQNQTTMVLPNQKVINKCTTSALFLFIMYTDMLTEYLVSNNLRNLLDVPDDTVLFQWVIDNAHKGNIQREKYVEMQNSQKIQAGSKVFLFCPLDLMFLGTKDLISRIVQTYIGYCENILSATELPDASVAFERLKQRFDPNSMNQEAFDTLSRLDVPCGYVGLKLKIQPLEYLFELSVFNKLSSGINAAESPAEQPLSAAPEALLLDKSKCFAKFLESQESSPPVGEMMQWWSKQHDAFLIVCLYEVKFALVFKFCHFSVSML